MPLLAPIALIANPTAGSGRAGRRLGRVLELLRPRVGEIQVHLSERRGHASDLAHKAIDAGARTVIALGGDGTHGEVTQGIMRSGAGPGEVTLGLLPGGTGGDFCRILEHEGTIGKAVRGLFDAAEHLVDVGVVAFTAPGGVRDTRHFLNIASAGASALVDQRVNASSKRLGGTLTFLSATLAVLARYEPPRVRVEVDGRLFTELELATVTVCNGRYAGGGMCFAPDARLADGLFDVVVFEHAPLHRAMALSPSLYRGTHLGSPLVSFARASHVVVTALGRTPLLVDVDGETPGGGPLDFRLERRALRLLAVRPETL